MTSNARLQKTYFVDVVSAGIIESVARSLKTSESDALDEILRQYVFMVMDGSVTPRTIDNDLTEIKSRLDNIEEFMSQFELVPDEVFSVPSE